MDNRHKNIDQLDGNTSMDSDTSCEQCDAKGNKENMMVCEGDDDYDDEYFCNQNCLTDYNEYCKKIYTLRTLNREH